jgi:hypothetical protein
MVADNQTAKKFKRLLIKRKQQTGNIKKGLTFIKISSFKDVKIMVETIKL